MAHDDRSAVEVLTPHREDGNNLDLPPAHPFLRTVGGVITLTVVALFSAQFFLTHARFESRAMLPVLGFMVFGMLFLIGFGFHLLFGRDHA